MRGPAGDSTWLPRRDHQYQYSVFAQTNMLPKHVSFLPEISCEYEREPNFTEGIRSSRLSFKALTRLERTQKLERK